MDLSPPLVLGLLSLPILLVGLVLYLRRRWVEGSVRRELEQIGQRLSPDELRMPPRPMALEAEHFAEFYRRVARADLKVGALLARLGHGEVDLDERLEAARQSLREIIEFAAERQASSRFEWRSVELLDLLEQSDGLLAEPIPEAETGNGEPNPVPPVDGAAWGRLAGTLRSLRSQLRQEFNTKVAGEVDSALEAGEDRA